MSMPARVTPDPSRPYRPIQRSRIRALRPHLDHLRRLVTELTRLIMAPPIDAHGGEP